MTTSASDTAGSALFLTDRSGRIVMSDAHAARLLALANDSCTATNDASLPDWLAPILDERRARNHSKLAARREFAPQIERLNVSGRFVFRAYRLQSVRQNGDAGLFAVSVEHYAPVATVIDAAAANNGLSERQRRVCVEMLNGASYAEIGRALDIKESTVVDHVRRIYEKLDIHSRDELRKKLL